MPDRVAVAVALFGAPPLLGLLLARVRRAAVGVELRPIDLLVPLGLAAQLVQVLPRATSLAVAYALLVTWAVVRVATAAGPARIAFGALLLGGVLNAVPILLNGAMPYSASAERIAGGLKGTRIDGHTALPMLGDIIPLPAGKFMSVGDVVLAIGTVLTVSLILGTAPARGTRIPAHPTSSGV
jgi:hypothetical protein